MVGTLGTLTSGTIRIRALISAALHTRPAFRTVLAGLTVAVFGALSVRPAAAQDPNGKIFDSWRVMCNVPGGAPSKCRMFQNVVLKETREPILQFIIGYSGQASPFPIGLFIVPLGIHLPSGVTLKVDGGQAYQLSVEVCLPQGCQIRFGFDKNFLDLFKKGSKATVSFFSGGNRQPYNVPVSLKGFSAALAAIR
jgi:invasion protein IalB